MAGKLSVAYEIILCEVIRQSNDFKKDKVSNKIKSHLMNTQTISKRKGIFYGKI